MFRYGVIMQRFQMGISSVGTPPFALSSPPRAWHAGVWLPRRATYIIGTWFKRNTNRSRRSSHPAADFRTFRSIAIGATSVRREVDRAAGFSMCERVASRLGVSVVGTRHAVMDHPQNRRRDMVGSRRDGNQVT